MVFTGGVALTLPANCVARFLRYVEQRITCQSDIYLESYPGSPSLYY